jgi:hypothetical protein
MTHNITDNETIVLHQTIAGFIAEGLGRLMETAEDSCTEQVPDIDNVRKVFADYANDDFPFWVGQNRATDLDDALVWLALNFRNLWD